MSYFPLPDYVISEYNKKEREKEKDPGQPQLSIIDYDLLIDPKEKTENEEIPDTSYR